MSKNRPRSAERRFALMCSDFGATCNKAEEDVNGWDYIVELPPDNRLIASADMQPGPRACLVQIKSSSGHSTRMKLSNALRFSQSPLPCFLVLFSSSDQPNSAYITHFWTDQISRTLKSVREAERDNKKLHKAHLSFSFEPSSKVENLLESIERSIQGIGEHYAQEKQKTWKSIGFDTPSFVGNFSFAEGVTLDEIIDHQLGKTDGLRVTQFVAHSVRFGIKSKTPHVSTTAGTLKISPSPIHNCSVLLSSNLNDEQVSFAATVIIPNFPGLPEAKRRVKVDAGPFEMLLTEAASDTFDLRKSYAEKISVDEQARFAKLLRLLKLGPLDCKIFVKSRLVLAGEITANEVAIEPFWNHLEPFLSIAASATPEHSSNPLHLSIDELIQRINEIAKFVELVQGSSFAVSAEVEGTLPEIEKAFVFYHCYIDFAGYRLVAFILRSGTAELNGEKFTCAAQSIIQKTVVLIEGPVEQLENYIEIEVLRRTKFAEKIAGSAAFIHMPTNALIVAH